MTHNILSVAESVFVDNSVTNYQFHSHTPYANTTFLNNDEVRIPIQNQDLMTLPSESYLYIEGKLLNSEDKTSATLRFTNNGFAFLFDEIRYELGGVVVDRNRNPGITSTIKTYVSFSKNEMVRWYIAGWNLEGTPTLTDTNGNFNVCIPLRLLLGFGEDFKKIIVNTRQELVLVRSNSDLNAVVTTVAQEKPQITLNKIIWKVPHISLSDTQKLKFLQYIERGRDLPIAFRCWELHEYPLLQQTMMHTWSVKAASQLEKPRFIIIAFQTNRKNLNSSNMSEFDHCNITNMKVYLNSEVYPYDNLNLNFDQKQYAVLYEMFINFQKSFYYKDIPEPCMNPYDFSRKTPLFVIDCNHQMETIKTGNVDVRIEFETNKNIPDKTSAYCLIIHDRLVNYNPLTNVIRIM